MINLKKIKETAKAMVATPEREMVTSAGCVAVGVCGGLIAGPNIVGATIFTIGMLAGVVLLAHTATRIL